LEGHSGVGMSKKSKKVSDKKSTQKAKKPNQKISDSYEVTKLVELTNEVAKSERHFKVVAVGASAGGLESIEEFIRYIPAKTGYAYFIIQHLSPDFKSFMPEILSRKTQMRVIMAEDGMEFQANDVYLLPPKKNMTLQNGVIALENIVRTQIPNKPIDLFFKSLAHEMGNKSIGLVFSGTGTDGAKGVQDLYEKGAQVMVESPETAQFDGMPNAAIATRAVHFIGSSSGIGKRVARDAGIVLKQDLIQNREASELTDEEETKQKIFLTIQDRYDVDFGRYKLNSVKRRIDRRLASLGIHSASKYHEYLLKNPEEVSNLFYEMLIGVTRFIRDQDAFQKLQDEVVPKLLEEKPEDEEIRVWVAGCATGEEVYSLVILFFEEAKKLNKNMSFKFFATDIDDESLAKASAGNYRYESFSEIQPDWLEKYFDKEEEGYKIKSSVRKAVVFARHNLLSDPPFMKMDMISCRNLLIYFGDDAQKDALSVFYNSLNKKGCLFLGPSESLGNFESAFEIVDRQWKIYRKKSVSRLLMPTSHITRPMKKKSATFTITGKEKIPIYEDRFILSHAYENLLQDFIPPSLLLNDRLELLHMFGDMGQFLQQRPGPIDRNIKTMVPDKFHSAVLLMLQRAKRSKKRVEYNDVQTFNKDRSVNLQIVPLFPKGKAEHVSLFLLSIKERVEDLEQKQVAHETMQHDHDVIEQVKVLQEELQASRENLQATIEELETTNEELQSTNEEMLASNEELQSTNEELHSVNEELFTVNSEYQKKIEELMLLTRDEKSFLKGTAIGVVFLDKEMLIRKFTPVVSEEFCILDQDIGRPLNHISHNFKIDDLPRVIKSVMETKKVKGMEVSSLSKKTYLLRILPFYDDFESVDGAVLTFTDVSELKGTEKRLDEKIIELNRQKLSAERNAKQVQVEKDKALQAEQKVRKQAEELDSRVEARTVELMNISNQFKSLYDSSPELEATVLSKKLTIENCNTTFARKLGYRSKEEVIGRNINDVVGINKKTWRPFSMMLKKHEECYNKEILLTGNASDPKPLNVLVKILSLYSSAKPDLDRMRLVLTDITSLRSVEKQLVEEKELLKIMSELNTDGWWDWNLLESSEMKLSDGFKKQLGFMPEEVSNSLSWFKHHMYAEDLKVFLKAIVQHTDNAKAFNLPLRFISKDNELVWMICRAYALKDQNNKSYRMLGSMTNISDMKGYQKQLEKSNSELQQFAHASSHDLQAPLRHIGSFTNLLSEKINESYGGDQDIKKWIDIVESSVDTMKKMLEDLLEFSMIGNKEIELESTDLNKVLEHLQSVLMVGFDEKDILTWDMLPKVKINKFLIIRVFQNLIENSLKFSEPNKDIKVKVCCEEKETEWIVSVHDNGIGFEMHHIDKIFRVFSTLNPKAKYKGSGIGLSIFKKIVMDSFGGKVWAESNVGVGSKFYFTIPKQRHTIQPECVSRRRKPKPLMSV